MKPSWRLWFAFPENGFNFGPQKFTKKVKNIIFEPSKQSFFTFRKLQSHFLKCFQRPNLDLMFWSIFYIFEGFDFIFWKMASWYNFVFDLKVASDLLSNPKSLIWLVFNTFNMVFQKTFSIPSLKNLQRSKNFFHDKPHNICYLSQVKIKTIS